MPFMACPDCNSVVSSQAPACPKCGRPFASIATDERPCKKCKAFMHRKGTEAPAVIPALLLGGAVAAVVFRAVDIVPVALACTAVLVFSAGQRRAVLYCPTCKAWR
jgi:hypothetical protein